MIWKAIDRQMVPNDGGHIVQTKNRPPPVLGNTEFVTSLYVYGRNIRHV